jgi:hypothetical protein
VHRVDSSSALRVVAKHLFRHLTEPRALRKNPLVSSLFHDANRSGLDSVRHERAVLDWILDLVRRGADECRDQDMLAGKRERALRQHAIIVLQCIERRPIREVATALGISCYHCYRERAAICRRVAQYVGEHSSRQPSMEPVSAIDEFSLLIEHFKHRAVFGNAESMRLAFDELLDVAPTTERKIEALRAAASRSIDFGNVTWAEHSRRIAGSIVARETRSNASATWNTTHAQLALFDSMLAYRQGRNAEALRTAEQAVGHLASVEDHGSHMQVLYTESLLDLAIALWSVGDTRAAYERVVEAERSLRNLKSECFAVRARVIASVWKLRNYLVLEDCAYYPAQRRLRGMVDAFGLAYHAGFLSEAIDALVVMTEHYAFTGDDDSALRAGRFALRLSRYHHIPAVRAHVSIEVGVRLLPTKHSQCAMQITHATRLDSLDAYHRELLALFRAEQALRQQRYRTAGTLAKRSGDAGRWATLGVRKQLVAVASTYALGNAQEARAMVEAVLADAELLRSAPILRDAYRVAGTVTGEARFERKAKELARLLSA